MLVSSAEIAYKLLQARGLYADRVFVMLSVGVFPFQVDAAQPADVSIRGEICVVLDGKRETQSLFAAVFRQQAYPVFE